MEDCAPLVLSGSNSVGRHAWSMSLPVDEIWQEQALWLVRKGDMTVTPLLTLGTICRNADMSVPPATWASRCQNLNKIRFLSVHDRSTWKLQNLPLSFSIKSSTYLHPYFCSIMFLQGFSFVTNINAPCSRSEFSLRLTVPGNFSLVETLVSRHLLTCCTYHSSIEKRRINRKNHSSKFVYTQSWKTSWWLEKLDINAHS